MATEDDSDDDPSNADPNNKDFGSARAVKSVGRSQKVRNTAQIETAGWRRVSTYDVQYHQVIPVLNKSEKFQIILKMFFKK